MDTAWVYLAAAIVGEIVWGLSLKSSKGFTRLWPSIINISTIIPGLYFLSAALDILPVSLAYPIWTGLGGVGITIGGFILYKERLGLIQIFFIFLIISGTVGLELGQFSN